MATPGDSKEKAKGRARPRHELNARVLLSVGSLALVLLLAEGGLRVAYPRGLESPMEGPFAWLVRQPVFGWRNQAGYRIEPFSINQHHLRGPEIELGKPAGVVRVLCLGDSRTFGIWLDNGKLRFDNDYPRLLGEVISDAQPGRRIEVLNLGVIGYTTSHGLRQLETVVPSFEPDVLIVSFGINDHVPSWNPALRVASPRSRLLRGLLSATYDWRLLQLGMAAWQGIGGLHPPVQSVPWVTPTDFTDNLRRIVETARRQDLHLLFLYQGLRPLEMGEDLPANPGETPSSVELLGARDLADLHRQHQEYQERLEAVARETDVPLLDARSFLGRGTRPPAYGPYDLVHLSVDGARQVAEALHAELRELGWI